MCQLRERPGELMGISLMDDDVCPQVVGWRAMQPIHRGRAQHVDVEEAVDTLHGSASGAMAGTMKTEKKEGSWERM